MKKRILCFGDSNTWGYTPLGERYGEDARWPMRMSEILGGGYRVIEEGLNGRTTLLDDPTEGGYKNGAAYLPPCLMSHNPLDLVIIMLGTNDTKQRFCMNAYNIAQGVGQLIRLARNYALDAEGRVPELLIVSPVLIGENLMDTIMGPIFGPQAIETAKGFAEEYRKLALLHSVHFLDAARFARPSPIDAIHLGREAHLALAQAIADKAREILSRQAGRTTEREEA